MREIKFLEEVIETWLKDLKGGIPHGPETDKATCETGDEVVTIGISFMGEPVVPEGNRRLVYEEPVCAWAMFKRAFSEYRRGRKGRIYWRQTPVVCEMSFAWDEESKTSKSAKYFVWARCFISKEGE